MNDNEKNAYVNMSKNKKVFDLPFKEVGSVLAPETIFCNRL